LQYPLFKSKGNNQVKAQPKFNQSVCFTLICGKFNFNQLSTANIGLNEKDFKIVKKSTSEDVNNYT